MSPDPTVAGRADRVRARLESALVVSDLTNVRWLTGFTGSNGYVVLAPDRFVLVTDGRYGLQARNELAAHGVQAEVVVIPVGADIFGVVGGQCAGLARVGFESAHLTVRDHGRLARSIDGELVSVDGAVEAERRTKSQAEVDALARACAIADQALAEVVPLLTTGVTEAEVRNRLDARMRELGADGPSYDTIVATGPVNAAKPHHSPGDTRIEPGHTVVIDVGALVDGYHSDMTRSFLVGPVDDRARELYDVVLHAQAAGLAAVRPGVAAKEIDHACREVIEAAGLGEWFTHGTGHAVGLVIHEEPFLGRSSDAILQVGDVVTIEPGVYREGFGGIRIEDLVVVTGDGCRLLTASPKDSPCPPSPPTT